MNFAAFATGIAAGFALLLLRRDLFEQLSARFGALGAVGAAGANGAAGAAGIGAAGASAGCVKICDTCAPVAVTSSPGQTPIAAPATVNTRPFQWFSVS